MKKLKRAIATLMVVGLMMVVVAGSAAADSDVDVVATAPAALAETSIDNLAHMQSVAAQAGNWSCRLEAPAFVSQPEVDSRVTVKGEDTAATTGECVDIQLAGTDDVTVRVFLEYYRPGYGWVPILDSAGRPHSKTCSLPAIKGVGATPCVIDVIYPAGHAAQGYLHRVGAEMLSPNVLRPIYTVAPNASLKALKAAE